MIKKMTIFAKNEMNFDEKLTILNIFSENNEKILVKNHEGPLFSKNISKNFGQKHQRDP
jgi:hypothetical protein